MTADPLAVATIIAAGLATIPATMAVVIGQRTHHAMQPNGESIGEVLHKIIELGEYQHVRNHDVANSLQRIEAKLAKLDGASKPPGGGVS